MNLITSEQLQCVGALNWLGRRCGKLFGAICGNVYPQIYVWLIWDWKQDSAAEVRRHYTVSKIAITFNYLAGCTNQNGEPEGPVST